MSSVQNYLMVAGVIAAAYDEPGYDPGTLRRLAEDFADRFTLMSRTFSRERFLAAARGEPISSRDR